ncbi:MAG TPA: LUD domain-containing protein [Sphingobacteriaceae bacterium]
MTSRDKILKAVAENQPVRTPLHQIPDFSVEGDLISSFITVAEKIGSRVFRLTDLNEVEPLVLDQFPLSRRTLSLIPEISRFYSADMISGESLHAFENVNVAVIKGHFGVAENSAVWITEDLTGQRVMPFIAEHLVIVINITDIVGTMHDAYQKISGDQYGYGVFIAGPSKTADIEQSLVLGAHGPRSLTLLLLDR